MNTPNIHYSALATGLAASTIVPTGAGNRISSR
jgi:hypothetical protein